MSRKVKSVSFNLDDPFELELYEHSLDYPNFSLFVKRLIHDSRGGKVKVADKVVPISQPTNPTVDKEYLRQLI